MARSVMWSGSASGTACLVLIWVGILLPPAVTGQPGTDNHWPIAKIYAEISRGEESEIIGKTVTVSGTVTVSTGLFHESFLKTFIQDTTAGISVFKGEIDQPFKAGDSLVVRGRVQRYFGLIEVHAEKYEVYPEAGRQITPLPLQAAFNAPEAFRGQLLSGKGVIIEKGTMHYGKFLRIGRTGSSANANTIMVHVSNFHPDYQRFDFQTPTIGDEIRVAGVLGEYVDGENAGGRSFELYLRSPSDFTFVGFPRYYLVGLIIGLTVISFLITVWIVLLKSRVRAKTREIQQALKEKDTLLREIHHRVKNNLAVVGGLLDLQMNNTRNEEVLNVLQDSRARIQSMALIHEKLYATDSLSQIRLDLYLKELVETIHSTFNNHQEFVELKFAMQGVNASVDKAIPSGLLINELVTNAFKHAFKAPKGGTLTVCLEKENGSITLTVADDGPGLPHEVMPGQSESLGMRLIQTFVAQLSAEMEIRNEEGTRISVTFATAG